MSCPSDPSAAPEVHKEQITSIYPIADDQPSRSGNAILSRDAGTRETGPGQTSNGGGEDLLIDFGETDAPSSAQSAETPGEIEGLLKSTSKPAEGLLIDFAEDLKDSTAGGDKK
jgi:hypothetical protein